MTCADVPLNLAPGQVSGADIEFAAGRLLHRDEHALARPFITGIGQERQVLQVGPGPGRTSSRAAVRSWVLPGSTPLTHSGTPPGAASACTFPAGAWACRNTTRRSLCLSCWSSSPCNGRRRPACRPGSGTEVSAQRRPCPGLRGAWVLSRRAPRRPRPCTGRRWPGRSRSRRQGDLDSAHRKRAADRHDPEFLLVLVDEMADQLCRGSYSRAKKPSPP